MITREKLLTSKFYDYKQFPYGFARSGDFTINEAQTLEKVGAYYKALTEGQLKDLTPEEVRLIRVFSGESEPSTLQEKVWLKYSKGPKRIQVWLTEREKQFAEDDEFAEMDIIDFDSDLDEDFED